MSNQNELLPTWTLWKDQRPTDHTISYRWRIKPRLILGMMLQPEWTDCLHLVGMGHDAAEYWPNCSSWDGYKRTVPDDLEWSMSVRTDETIYHGLDLLPSPFTGLPPMIGANVKWVGAPLWQVESFSLQSFLVSSHGWKNAKKMQDAWNTRALQSNGPAVGEGYSKFAPIFEELERATRKFPTWPTDPIHALKVVDEEVGELSKEVFQMVYEPHKTTMEDVRTEAIQAAAMALRFYLSLDRYEYRPGEQHNQESL